MSKTVSKEGTVRPRLFNMDDGLYFDLEYLAKDKTYDTTTNYIRKILMKHVEQEKKKRKVTVLPRTPQRIEKITAQQ